MQTLLMDASKMTTTAEIENAFRAAIGAPEWHGHNGDAYVDSMIWEGINSVEPPYEIRILGLGDTPDAVRRWVAYIAAAVRSGREWRKVNRGEDVQVSVVQSEGQN